MGPLRYGADPFYDILSSLSSFALLFSRAVLLSGSLFSVAAVLLSYSAVPLYFLAVSAVLFGLIYCTKMQWLL